MAIGLFKHNLQKFMFKYPDLHNRFLINEHDIEQTYVEMILRIFWNTLNLQAQYSYDQWDEEQIVAFWFKDYNNEFVRERGEEMGEPVDVFSLYLFEEVISPIVDFFRNDLSRKRIKENWEWEEHHFVRIKGKSVFMENLGDFRIRDWYRLKEKYEGNTRDDPYGLS